MEQNKNEIMRKDVPSEDTWDVGSIYPDQTAWEAHFEKTRQAIEKLKKIDPASLGNPDNALNCLNLSARLEREIDKLFTYAHLQEDTDMSDAENAERMGKARDLGREYDEAAAFINPSLAKITGRALKRWRRKPEFTDHSFYLRKIAMTKPHILPAEQAKIVATLSEILGSPQKIAKKLRDVDMKFPPIYKGEEKNPLTNSTFHLLRKDPDRGIRFEAMEKLFREYKKYRHTLAEALNAHVKKNVLLAKLKRYNHVLEMFFAPNAIDLGVYENLIAAANENIPLLRRYGYIRKERLKTASLKWYDLYVDLVKGVDNKYTFDQAVELVLGAIKPLGENYLEKLEFGLTKGRWVDRYENKAKRSGAYSSGCYDSRPFILLNFQNDYDSVSTLAHEAGHSMHSLLSKQENPYTKYVYDILVAEIASICNENLLDRHMLKGADDRMRAYILNQQFEGVRATFFRQAMFAEFEKRIYDLAWEGKVLTADLLEENYYELNVKYYGKTVIPDIIRSEWSFIPHFYYDFYVYKYATGIACAAYFSEKVVNGGEQEVENYLNLLKAGGSDYPTNLLLASGLDMQKPDYIRALMKKFEGAMDEFEKIGNV